MIPGEMLVAPGDLELNVGRAVVKLTVANTGDRPVQVGSHYHFFEANDALRFDRAAARGHRLNIAAGTAVRFEPGQEREVELVALAGERAIYGFQARVMGPLEPRRASRKAPAVRRKAEAKAKAKAKAAAKSAAAKKAARKSAAGRGGRRAGSGK